MSVSAAEDTIYILDPEPLLATGPGLSILSRLGTQDGGRVESQGRVHTAFAQGRSLLAELDFGTAQ